MIEPRKRPKETKGRIFKIETGCGNMYVIVSYLSDEDTAPFEVFATLGKAGQCGAAQIETICRSVSLALRCEVNPEKVIKQLRGIRCPSIKWSNGASILSCGDGIAKALMMYLGKEIGSDEQQPGHLKGSDI